MGAHALLGLHQQYNNLDDQLAEVERVRAQRAQEEEDAAARLRAVAQERARNMARGVRGL